MVGKTPITLPTLPEVHRQVLLALLTDLVQRWAQVEHPMPSGSFAHPPARPSAAKNKPLANKVVLQEGR